ncbi:MAG: 16S rRNA (cytosine(1402)-N(4))-methyltransferase RsmH [Flavobacteriaceae bacterium]|nr:16S rRNA (cytosine(1402)-N(4))-methyltransferase RsmH [Flavobacteriaceae bacterium]
MNEFTYHRPVLLNEAISGLNIKPNGTYVDVTFGGGGHSKAILDALDASGKLFAFDQDESAIKNNIEDPRFVLINENFGFLKNFLRLYGLSEIDGLLADLGVSSHQFDQADRGFSTRFDAVLDMRMDKKNAMTARHILNEYDEKSLQNILFQYGELRNAKGMAATLIHFRKTKPIETTEDLKTALAKFLPGHIQNKVMAQIFQAIRIEVNQELEALKKMLVQAGELLKKEGRLVVISYHSLEDRLVKRYMRNGQFEGEPERDIFGNFTVPMKPIGKFTVPTVSEIQENSRARSAKLRIAEKL